MRTLEEAIKHAEYIAGKYSGAVSVCWSAIDNKQLAGWLRELQERRKADSCDGCAFEDCDWLGCLTCKRRCKDKYAPERRTDEDT